MNTLQTDIAIVTAILWLMAIAVVAYDRIKYRKYYASKSKLVLLRINNAAVREFLSQNGIKLCQCAYYNTENGQPLKIDEVSVYDDCVILYD